MESGSGPQWGAGYVNNKIRWTVSRALDTGDTAEDSVLTAGPQYLSFGWGPSNGGVFEYHGSRDKHHEVLIEECATCSFSADISTCTADGLAAYKESMEAAASESNANNGGTDGGNGGSDGGNGGTDGGNGGTDGGNGGSSSSGNGTTSGNGTSSGGNGGSSSGGSSGSGSSGSGSGSGTTTGSGSGTSGNSTTTGAAFLAASAALLVALQ